MIEPHEGVVHEEDRGHAAIGEALEPDGLSCQAGSRPWNEHVRSLVGASATSQVAASGVVKARFPSRHSRRKIHPPKPGRV